MGVVCVSSDELIEEGKRAIRQDRIREEVTRNDEKEMKVGSSPNGGTLKEGLKRQKQYG